MAIIQDDQKGVKMPCTQTSVLFNGTDFFLKNSIIRNGQNRNVRLYTVDQNIRKGKEFHSLVV